MAPSSVNPLPLNTTKRVPTEEEVAMAGGVWAPTSAKRDKLAEFKIALKEGQQTLDDAATTEQLLDLYLADGIKLIAKVTDIGSDDDISGANVNEMSILAEFSSCLDNQVASSSAPSDGVNQTELEAKLQVVSSKLSTLLERIPSDRCLRNVRDFFDPQSIDGDDLASALSKANNKLEIDQGPFRDAVTRFRLLLAKAAVDQMQKSWKVLTTVSDSDIDRAAVKGIALKSQVDTISLSSVFAFIQSHVRGTCSDRVTAAWNLLDRDQDRLLDTEEMNQAVFLCLGVEQEALLSLFKEALDAYPTRAPLPEIGNENQVPVPKGWRQRRTENKTKKRLLNMFQKSCKNHFRDEVEINHRLRCIYAWAEKADQDNKIDNVLVDADEWSGRKRYVELSPKISEAEFREVQKVHFTHLDRIGSEILKSFREDLWVDQGKGRERKELARDCLLFLAVVSAIDYVILLL
jgi:hypothetical protein